MRESVPLRLSRDFRLLSFLHPVVRIKFCRANSPAHVLATSLNLPPVRSAHDRALSFILPRMRDQGAPRERYFKIPRLRGSGGFRRIGRLHFISESLMCPAIQQVDHRVRYVAFVRGNQSLESVNNILEHVVLFCQKKSHSDLTCSQSPEGGA